MVINKFEVSVYFELATVEADTKPDHLCLELNMLFNDIVKAWAKDKNCIVTTAKTALEGDGYKW